LQITPNIDAFLRSKKIYDSLYTKNYNMIRILNTWNNN
jgi:hypothetical protein